MGLNKPLKLMEKLTIDRESVLELISCADDYGFNKPILISAFAEWLGNLSDEDIEEYARKIEALDGYGYEAYLEIKYRLNEFREDYLTENKTSYLD